MAKKEMKAIEDVIVVQKKHIVFGESDVTTLEAAIALDETLAGEVVIIRDDFMVGPLENIYETEGYQRRRAWWQSHVEASPYNTDALINLVDDRLSVHNLKKFLAEDSDAQLWIWAGQNAHDVCGYYWLITQLQDYNGRIYILYLNNLPFINEKGQIFYPSYLHQILPKEFIKAKKLARKVTPSEFEVDSDEWRKLCAENGMVRILEGGKKVVTKEETFFDADILNNLTTEPQKGSKALHNILGKMKIKTGDLFILHRMFLLQEAGKLHLLGDPTQGWKEFEVKLTLAEAVTASESTVV